MASTSRPRASRVHLGHLGPVATLEPASRDDPSPMAELPEAQPRSMLELLERTVAAVTDDARGRRIRLALLTTVQTAAAEAGEPVPLQMSDLRARVLRGAVPWIGAGGVFVDTPNAED